MKSTTNLSYFNVKVTEKEIKAVSFLTKLIIEHWGKNKSPSSVRLSKTYLQKVLFKIANTNKEFDFITRGWYKYGGILVQAVQQEDFLVYKNISAKSIGIEDEDKIRSIVFDICDEYNPNDDLQSNWQKKQYLDFNQDFYLFALELRENLMHEHISVNNCKSILSKLKISFPSDELLQREVKDIFFLFISLAEYTLTDRTTESKELLLDTYNTVWDFFATYNFFVTVTGDTKDDVKKSLETTFEGIRLSILNSLIELGNQALPTIKSQESMLENIFSKKHEVWGKILSSVNGDVQKASEIYDSIMQIE